MTGRVAPIEASPAIVPVRVTAAGKSPFHRRNTKQTAVDSANAHSVMHKIFNPMNVRVNEDSRVLLTHWSHVILTEAFQDFELCNRYRNQLGYSSGQAGFTPAYAAPELVNRDLAPITERTLVYQCGAILFEIVSGQPPHSGQGFLSVLKNAAPDVIRNVERSGQLHNEPCRRIRRHVIPLSKNFRRRCRNMRITTTST